MKSIRILEYPQGDLGCTITIEEEISPTPGTLRTEITGKNASASGYVVQTTFLRLTRTGA